MVKKQKSIKQNFIINGFRVVFNILFPVIVFPYASRILMPEGIGRVDFASSVIAYFIMLSSLGIPLYGIRECAKVRDDRQKLSKVTQELFILNAASTAAAYVILFLCIAFIPRLYQEKELIILTSISVFFTTLGVDWLYQAMEEYTYITVRSIVFKLISLAGLFLLVKTSDDYIIYAAILIFSSVGSNILNAINARKIVSFKAVRSYDFKRHIRPILTLFTMNLAISIYANLDTVMLGFLTEDREVGLYTASIRMSRVVIALVTSLGAVLLPRLSYFIEHGAKEEFERVVSKSVHFIMFISLPCIVFLFVFADRIIALLAGPLFAEATITMKILLPVILIIALSNLIGIQVLIPMGKEKLTLYSVIAGAVVNFTLNLILIPSFARNGAAAGSLIAEGTVTFIQIFFAWNLVGKIIFSKGMLKYITAGLFLLAASIVVNIWSGDNIFITLAIASVVSGIAYMAVLILLKDEILYDILSRIAARLGLIKNKTI